MEVRGKENDARELQQYRQDLEANIERIIRDFEREHDGPVELDVSFFEGEAGSDVDPELKARIRSMVDAFQRKPVVQRSEVKVHKVTAMDSDEDGRIVVRVHYDYAEEE